jgi:hypothetical protein
MRRPRIMACETILALLASLALTACGDKWDAYVYPDKTRLSVSARLADFSRQTLPGIVGDYECGKNCDGGKRLRAIAVCDETVR